MTRVLLVSLLLVGCAPQFTIEPGVLSSRYDAEFVAAGAKHDVPPELLAALSHALTRFEMVNGDDELGRASTWGLMAIPGDLVTDAAKTDASANIELAAQLLSMRATALGIDRRDLAAWAPVVLEYARIDAPTAQREFLKTELWKPLGLRSDTVEALEQALSPDYDLGVWRPSPNFNSRNGRTPQIVVIHTCEGGYSGCWGWQTNPASQVSAHYTVSDGSEVTQLVRESDRAWHVAATYDCANNNGVRCDLNGISTNTIAVGIEHAGFASQTSFPGSQIEASARLVCSITRNWGIPRDRNHILSHAQLQPNNRTDPGRNWPWDAFIARVKEICGDTPPPPCDHTAGPFTFSCDGAQAGQRCVQLNEPADPDTWTDNFLCTANDYGFRWSNAGPLEGMDCTAVHEGAEPLASVWADNFFCTPTQSPWIASYSSAGPIAGKACVALAEPQDLANSWADNFLCFEPRTRFTEGPFTFSMNGAVEGLACTSVDSGDPNTWSDNYFCSSADLGMRFSTTGPLAELSCTQITESADATPLAWADTWLCLPPGAPYAVSWSSAGPRDGLPCVRWFDHSESATWLDNWLCFSPVAPAPGFTPRLEGQGEPGMEPSTTLPLVTPDAPVTGGCSSSGASAALVLLLAWARRRFAARQAPRSRRTASFTISTTSERTFSCCAGLRVRHSSPATTPITLSHSTSVVSCTSFGSSSG